MMYINDNCVQIALKYGKLYLIYSLDSETILTKAFKSVEEAESILGKSLDDVDMFDLMSKYND